MRDPIRLNCGFKNRRAAEIELPEALNGLILHLDALRDLGIVQAVAIDDGKR